MCYATFKGIHQGRSWCIQDTVEFNKVSNGILTGLTNQGKTCVTIFYKLSVLLKKIINDNCH